MSVEILSAGAAVNAADWGTVRRTLSVLTAALIVTGLAACSSSSEPSPTSTTAAACKNVKEGSVSKSVKVSGKFRQTPTVTFDTPLKVSDIQRSVIIRGKGDEVTSGATVTLAVAAYNGTDGKELADSEGFGDKTPVTAQVDDQAFLPGFVRGVECLPVGSRVVVTAPAEEALGTSYSNLGLKENDPVVLVADIISLPPTKADGKTVTPPEGFPTVKLKASGEPEITIPKTDPPTETRVGQLKKGSGDTVLPGDTVTVQYKGVLWRNGEMFDSSWSRGAPASFKTNEVVKGFQKALEGQTVGSQVIAIIPPADGYGSEGQGDIKGTDTMVFVIDILAASR